MPDSKPNAEIKEDKTVVSETSRSKRKFEWTPKRKEAFEKCQAALAKKKQFEHNTSDTPLTESSVATTVSTKQSEPEPEKELKPKKLSKSQKALLKHRRNKKKLLRLMDKHYLATVPKIDSNDEGEETDDSLAGEESDDSTSQSGKSSSGDDDSEASESGSGSEPEMKPTSSKPKKKGSKTVSRRKIMREIKQLRQLVQSQNQRSERSHKPKFKKYRRAEDPEDHLLPSHTTPVTEAHSRRTIQPPEESFAHGNIGHPTVNTGNRFRFI